MWSRITLVRAEHEAWATAATADLAATFGVSKGSPLLVIETISSRRVTGPRGGAPQCTKRRSSNTASVQTSEVGLGPKVRCRRRLPCRKSTCPGGPARRPQGPPRRRPPVPARPAVHQGQLTAAAAPQLSSQSRWYQLSASTSSACSRFGSNLRRVQSVAT
ncbi:UTRA domain-containing protein [Pseudarthrobacter sp. H2]|uniref:UTRA domain-containing protein n=1 Tax=Pseudarthrobacter sp. H2 TaxID=3418415 RepID=UPI003CF26AC6